MIDVKIEGQKLVLSENVIKMINSDIGERVSIGYAELDGVLTPVLSADSTGNLLNKNLTVRFGGHPMQMLAKYGTEFQAKEVNNLVYLIGQNPVLITFTDAKQAAKYTIDKNIILDNHFTITNFSNYEF